MWNVHWQTVHIERLSVYFFNLTMKQPKKYIHWYIRLVYFVIIIFTFIHCWMKVNSISRMHRFFYKKNRFQSIALRSRVNGTGKRESFSCILNRRKTVQCVSMFQFSKHVFCCFKSRDKIDQSCNRLKVTVHCYHTRCMNKWILQCCIDKMGEWPQTMWN